MDVHVRELRYFVAVAEELSFTRAARDRLFVSQPALSKQIRHLELSLRVTLLDRDRRVVSLTPAGRALLPRARQIVEQWDEARQEVADARTTGRSTLTVGFQTRIGRGLIPTVTARLDEVLPGWGLRFRQVSWSDPAVGLGSPDVDVAIAWLPVPDSQGLSCRVVSTEDRWVALPARHRLAARAAVPFEDLADEPFIALPPSAGSRRDFWLATDQRRTPPRIAAEVDTADETFEAVSSGLGIVLLSAGNVAVYQREDVVCRPVSGLPPSHLAVVWRTGDDRAALRAFVDACPQPLCGAGWPVP
ncbi:LysR family transcriptional regulator [Actinosynnema sp. CS-041913]|uniref:LysR family transcriptional regulator n=1 Tax=Actinosynnema sp. CS-041913 TaxID=3239917 RepID=UPI003D8B0DCB